MVFSTALAQTAMKVMSKALNTFKSSGKSLGGMTSNFDALSKSMNGKHSNLGRSAKNAQRDLDSYSSNCASMSQATDNFIAGMQETESRVEELDNSAHEMFMKAFEQFQGKQISAVAGILVSQTTGADIFGKDSMGKKQPDSTHRQLGPSAIATTVKFKVNGEVVEIALNEQEAAKWEKMKKAAGKKGLNRGDLAQMLGAEDLSKDEFYKKYGMSSQEKQAYEGYKKSLQDAQVKESEALANAPEFMGSLSSGSGIYANGKNYAGATNEEFVPMDVLITDNQSNFTWGVNGKTHHQGEIAAPSVETQQYLYNLSQTTGMDYPLLLGIWCSESTASETHSGSGGTMGLTNPTTWSIINNQGYTYKGQWYSCPNNYKEQIDAAVQQTYRETYGVDPDPSIMQKGNVYYDAAVSVCMLEYSQNHYKTGGSCNNSTAAASFHMYAQTKDGNGNSGYYGRAVQYAESIRENMGWESVDYEKSMATVNTSAEYDNNIQWV